MRGRYLLIVSIAAATAATAVSAGNPYLPPAPPDRTYSYTLMDIYDRLDSGAAGSPSAFTEPTSGPETGTGHTLDEIMGIAPTVDSTDGATQTHVLTGMTAWGLTSGQWGWMTGTMPNHGAVTMAPTSVDQSIPAGYHDGEGHVEGDTDLVPGNIAQGVDLFGVTGSAIVATGDATAADVLTGKTFSNATATGISGTMPVNGAVVITPTRAAQTIAAGYHDGAGYVEGDQDLLARNVVGGIDIFGVTGTAIILTTPAAVPSTGQTGCWDSSGTSISCTDSGQDGEYQRGVAWPNPRFTDNGNGTVTDNLTGLIWLKDAQCFGDVAWATALSNANTLNSGECGLEDDSSEGDWRLPNVRELQSLIDYDVYDPAVPNTAGTGKWSEGDPFANVISAAYWSSSTSANFRSHALSVYLASGVGGGSATKTGTYYVWPVRGGD